MKLIAFHPAAREELREAAIHYEEQASDLGSKFTDEVERAVHFVHEHPELGRRIDETDDIRRWSLRRFPYYVIYRAQAEALYVVAVAHQRRRVGYWRTRIRSS